MAPRPKYRDNNYHGYNAHAIILNAAQTHIFLVTMIKKDPVTRRRLRDRHGNFIPGKLGLPGGMSDQKDNDWVWKTAGRETKEEVLMDNYRRITFIDEYRSDDGRNDRKNRQSYLVLFQSSRDSSKGLGENAAHRHYSAQGDGKETSAAGWYTIADFKRSLDTRGAFRASGTVKRALKSIGRHWGL